MNTWCEFPEHLVGRNVPLGAKIWNILMIYDALVRRLGRFLVFRPLHAFIFPCGSRGGESKEAQAVADVGVSTFDTLCELL